MNKAMIEDMDITENEARLILKVRNLLKYQKIEIKLGDRGEVVYTVTTNERISY